MSSTWQRKDTVRLYHKPLKKAIREHCIRRSIPFKAFEIEAGYKMNYLATWFSAASHKDQISGMLTANALRVARILDRDACDPRFASFVFADDLDRYNHAKDISTVQEEPADATEASPAMPSDPVDPRAPAARTFNLDIAGPLTINVGAIPSDRPLGAVLSILIHITAKEAA